MGANRLENAAAAAGYAMVNPDDFAREAALVASADVHETPETVATAKTAQGTTTWSWLNWDYLRLTGNKATA